MMIVFQNQIIYMPSIPPGARRERIEDYAGECSGVRWVEERILAADGVELGMCVGENVNAHNATVAGKGHGVDKHVIILYFQGNASSLPPRLPLLSNVLRDLERASNPRVKYTLVALSYRGYWTSRGRASQKGIERDALAAHDWIHRTYFGPNADAPPARHRAALVLWGQSIGAGVATGLAAHQAHTQSRGHVPYIPLILETPFLSIPSMLKALYPQRWLPYRYLSPFLRNWWDSETAIARIGVAHRKARETERKAPVIIITAANDELVPTHQATRLEALCTESGLEVQRQDVSGALHTEATTRAEGRHAVVQFLKAIGERKGD
ncbi:hypothetical protein LOZ53_003253 [Ophidiomyces ophidiicola]|nr:hypothetical protein LOZ53_003253 [Ophidiomyces ophidiicola]